MKECRHLKGGVRRCCRGRKNNITSLYRIWRVIEFQRLLNIKNQESKYAGKLG